MLANEKVEKKLVQRGENRRNVANPQTSTTIHLDVRGEGQVRGGGRSETVETVRE